MVDAGRVDDPGCRPEPVAVQARRRLVERHVVECGRQGALLEVTADDRHGVDRRDRGHAQAAERRDQPAAGGVGEGRSSTDAGKTSDTCFAISCSVAVIPM